MSSRAKGKGGKGRAPSPTRAERKAFKAVAKAERVRKAQARDVQAVKAMVRGITKILILRF